MGASSCRRIRAGASRAWGVPSRAWPAPTTLKSRAPRRGYAAAESGLPSAPVPFRAGLSAQPLRGEQAAQLFAVEDHLAQNTVHSSRSRSPPRQTRRRACEIPWVRAPHDLYPYGASLHPGESQESAGFPGPDNNILLNIVDYSVDGFGGCQ